MNKQDKNKQYWLTIEAYVHLNIKKDWVLLYNSLTGSVLEYKEMPEIVSLAKRLLNPKNLGVIALTVQDMKAPAIATFLNDLRDNFMGDLIDQSLSLKKPAQMIPMVTIKKGVDTLKKDGERRLGEEVLRYLSDIYLYINGDCRLNCSTECMAYKQFSHCTKSKSKGKELPIDDLREFFSGISGNPYVRIHILGGDIFNYTKWDTLMDIVDANFVFKALYSDYRNIAVINSASAFERWTQNVDSTREKSKEQSKDQNLLKKGEVKLNILVSSPVDEDALARCMDVVKKSVGEGIKVIYKFIIQEEGDLEEAERLISLYGIVDYSFQPFFNEKNLEFFKANAFDEKEDILAGKPSMKEIHQNMTVNNLCFGKLTILSDGSIYSNVNTPCLGKLGKNSIYEVLFKEMKSGKGWRRVRKSVQPCKACGYESLCPPLSNFCYAIGRNNLCRVYS